MFSRIPFLAATMLMIATPALAHGTHEPLDTSPWSAWQWSPEILVGIVAIALIYWRGSRHGPVDRRWRVASFNAGLLALFVALISPVERLADHIFAVHQIEHMLLRTVGPMLLFLSRPQAAFVRGLPGGVSKYVVGKHWLRRVVAIVRFPPVATILFLASTYFWMYPRWHDLAILDEPVHYVWHASLLISGLIFFSVIFEHRSSPHGAGLGTRLAMFVFAALGNIVLGAFLTFKTVPLYSAYLSLGHLWRVSMLTDEQTGGIIMWIPGTMMFAVSALAIVHRWGSEETRLADRRARTGRELVASQRSSNQVLAFGLGAFALLMLVIAFSVVAVIDHPHGSGHDFGLAGNVPG